ncbi:aquaporin-like protein [Xylariales sp. PMI_506]|nr:aquaporin-like protein [Xylariales sp. PMI_506]
MENDTLSWKRAAHQPWERQSGNLDPETQSVSVPWVGQLTVGVQNELVAMLAEFVGTFMFLLFAFGGTHAANVSLVNGAEALGPPDASRLLFIALSFGLSLAVNVWVFFRVSGGQFNPAVTVGLALVGAVTPLRAGLLVVSQIFGAITAAGVIQAILPGPLSTGVTLSGGTTIAQGFFIEMFLTMQLVFTVFMLAVEKHKTTSVAPLGVGLSLFIAEMMGVAFTGGGVNPARSFAPSTVTGNFDSFHWIYWFGPLLGTLLAVGLYKALTLLRYQRVNPGQDSDGIDRVAFDAETFIENNIAYYNKGLSSAQRTANYPTEKNGFI